MQSGLALRGVTKRYARRGPWILSGTDLSLAPATWTSVVGSNGSGKSTLMRIAAGVTSPSGGTALIPRRLGFVPERQSGSGKFSADEYLAHMGRIRGMDPATIRKRGSELLERLALRPGPHVAWERLSKGNRQKVIVAQAFLGDCEAIVLDEPFSGLDHAARSALERLIEEAVDKGASVLTSGPETDGGESSDQTYQLVSGNLVEVQAQRQPHLGDVVKRVELTKNGSGPVEALCHVDGVLTWNADPSSGRLVLEVSEGAVGSVLRMALDQGWSVAFVGPQRDDRP